MTLRLINIMLAGIVAGLNFDFAFYTGNWFYLVIALVWVVSGGLNVAATLQQYKNEIFKYESENQKSKQASF